MMRIKHIRNTVISYDCKIENGSEIFSFPNFLKFLNTVTNIKAGIMLQRSYSFKNYKIMSFLWIALQHIDLVPVHNVILA